MPISRHDSVSDLVENFYYTLNEPIATISRWYSYYYLSEIEDIRQADFKLNKLTDNLYHALYDYALYACYKEISNKKGAYIIYEDEPEIFRSEAGENIEYIMSERPIQNKVQTQLTKIFKDNQYNLDAQKIAIILVRSKLDHPKGKDPRNISIACAQWNGQINLWERHEKALKQAKVIFETTPDFDTDSAINTRWMAGYGGPAWGAVAETALKYHDVTKKAFVDMMIQVEHNNGNFLNKISPDFEAEQEASEEPIMRHNPAVLESAAYKNNDKVDTYTDVDVYEILLPHILQKAREGEMQLLLEIAENRDQKITRWKRRANL